MTDLTKDEAEAQLKRKRKAVGEKAVVTKGPEERKRISLMANWTMAHGKNDKENPYSKENYYR